MLGRKNDEHGANGFNGAVNDTTTYGGGGANDSRKGIKSQPWFQRLLRITQALSALISLALFSTRVAKVIRLTSKLSRSNGAVEGILAAAVLYTVLITLLQLCTRAGGPNILRWIIMVLDLAFVGAFIAVAVETRPNGGPSGPCIAAVRQMQKNSACQLPLGTFILAIVSTVLHFITALYHTIRQRRQRSRDSNEKHAATAATADANDEANLQHYGGNIDVENRQRYGGNIGAGH